MATPRTGWLPTGQPMRCSRPRAHVRPRPTRVVQPNPRRVRLVRRTRMATVSPETIRTVNAMISSDALIRARVSDFITRSWTSLDNYRDADIARFIKAVLPVVQGAQWQLAALTDAYL